MVAGVELGCGSEQVARRQVTRTRLSARRTAPCLSDKSEARLAEVIAWPGGRALVIMGSPSIDASDLRIV